MWGHDVYRPPAVYQFSPSFCYTICTTEHIFLLEHTLYIGTLSHFKSGHAVCVLVLAFYKRNLPYETIVLVWNTKMLEDSFWKEGGKCCIEKRVNSSKFLHLCYKFSMYIFSWPWRIRTSKTFFWLYQRHFSSSLLNYF